MNTWSRKIKEFMDLTLGWLALIVSSPMLLLLAALILLDSPGPVFFCQRRIGKGGRPFKAYKFRSMVDRAVTMGLGLHVTSDDFRITRMGQFLRNTSLDELPQIFNVIRGEMSLVGPRPNLPCQVANYKDGQGRRLLVKPGITGWAQINGRNAIPWDDRIKLDLWYLDHWSLKLDAYILLRTFKTCIRREGLYSPDGINYVLGAEEWVDDDAPPMPNPESR